MVLSGPNKVSSSSSMTNQTCHFGIMGGLAPSVGLPAGVGMFRLRRARNKQTIPTGCVPGLQYMKEHDILSKNPAGSGGIGLTKVLVDRSMGPCNCGAPTAANTTVVGSDSLDGLDGLDGVDESTEVDIISLLDTQYLDTSGVNTTANGSGILISMFNWPTYKRTDEEAVKQDLGWRKGDYVDTIFNIQSKQTEACDGELGADKQTVGWLDKISGEVLMNVLCPNYTGPGLRCHGVGGEECSAMGKILSMSYIRADTSAALGAQIPSMVYNPVEAVAGATTYQYKSIRTDKMPYSPAARFVGNEFGKYFIIYDNSVKSNIDVEKQVLCSYPSDGFTGGDIETVCDGGEGGGGLLPSYNPATGKWTGGESDTPTGYTTTMLDVQRGTLKYGTPLSDGIPTSAGEPVYNEVVVKTWNKNPNGPTFDPTNGFSKGAGKNAEWGWKDALDKRAVMAYGVIGDGVLSTSDTAYTSLVDYIGHGLIPVVGLDTNSPRTAGGGFGFYKITKDTSKTRIPTIVETGFVGTDKKNLPAGIHGGADLPTDSLGYIYVTWNPATDPLPASNGTEDYTVTLSEENAQNQLVTLESVKLSLPSGNGPITYALPYPSGTDYMAPHWLSLSQNGSKESSFSAGAKQVAAAHLEAVIKPGWWYATAAGVSFWLEICTPGWGIDKPGWQITAIYGANTTFSYGGLPGEGELTYAVAANKLNLVGKAIDPADGKVKTMISGTSGTDPGTIGLTLDMDFFGTMGTLDFDRAIQNPMATPLFDAGGAPVSIAYTSSLPSSGSHKIDCYVLELVSVGTGDTVSVMIAACSSTDVFDWSYRAATPNIVTLPFGSLQGMFTPNIEASTLFENDTSSKATGITITAYYNYPFQSSSQTLTWSLPNMGGTPSPPLIELKGDLFKKAPAATYSGVASSNPANVLIAPINILGLYPDL